WRWRPKWPRRPGRWGWRRWRCRRFPYVGSKPDVDRARHGDGRDGDAGVRDGADGSRSDGLPTTRGGVHGTDGQMDLAQIEAQSGRTLALLPATQMPGRSRSDVDRVAALPHR